MSRLGCCAICGRKLSRGRVFTRAFMERIEAEGPASIWNVFIESAFGRRIAMASMALALLFGVYVVTAEQKEHSTVLTVSADAQARCGISRALPIATPFC